MSRSIESIDRDLQITMDRRRRAKVQIAQLTQGRINDARHLDRLLDERHAAAAAEEFARERLDRWDARIMTPDEIRRTP